MVRELMPPGYKPGTPGQGTHVLTQAVITPEDLPPENIAEQAGLRLIIVGKIQESLEGCACPMGVLGREFLTKLDLNEKEVALVDMEAGIEHFGRGVESGLNTVLMIVEPSFESINMAERIQRLASGIGIKRVGAIVNKASSESMSDRLVEELKKREVSILGALPYDEEVFTAGLEGQPLAEHRGKTGEAIRKIVDALLSSF